MFSLCQIPSVKTEATTFESIFRENVLAPLKVNLTEVFEEYICIKSQKDITESSGRI